jgi:chromosome segregation ATPase
MTDTLPEPEAIRNAEKAVTALRDRLGALASASQDYASATRTLEDVEATLKGLAGELEATGTALNEVARQLATVDPERVANELGVVATRMDGIERAIDMQREHIAAEFPVLVERLRWVADQQRGLRVVVTVAAASSVIAAALSLVQVFRH